MPKDSVAWRLVGLALPLLRSRQSERAETEPMSEKRLAHLGWPIEAKGRFSNELEGFV